MLFPAFQHKQNREILAYIYCRTEKDPEPPSEVVQSFVDIYNTRVYFQPLPLFRPGGLNERIRSAPQFLRFSFFAVMLHYNSHEFFASSRYLSQRFYRSEAQQEVDRLSKNVASLEVIQALCLLALSGILRKCSRPLWSCSSNLPL